MTCINARKTTVMFGASLLMLIGSGCATKKHVRNVVGPVEARVSSAEQRGREQGAAIGELNNSVSRADERAQDADRKATAAGESAGKAGEAALLAKKRADEGYSLAESTRARLGEFSENIDNYKMVTSESVLFGVNKFSLSKEAKQQLDNAVAQLKDTKNYILEIQGSADATGNSATNLELSKKRADAVVRYLTVQHQIALRRINTLGIGEEDPSADNKTREGRKMARRVEMRVFSRDFGAQSASGSTAPSPTAPIAQQ